MSYEEIKVTVKLQGWFPDIYEFNKPKDMSDEAYINAIVSSWLMDRDNKHPCPKISTRIKGVKSKA